MTIGHKPMQGVDMSEQHLDEDQKGRNRGPCAMCTHFSDWYGQAGQSGPQVVICQKEGKLRINTTPSEGCMQ